MDILERLKQFKRNDYQRDNLKYNKYNPLTQNTIKIKDENINPNIYETYKPSINYNASKVTKTISTNHRNASFGSKISLTHNSKREEKINGHKNSFHIPMNYKEPEEKYTPQQIFNYEYQKQKIKNQASYGNISIEERTTENIKSEQIPIPVESLKYGNITKLEKKTLYEGPKYQYKAKDGPKLVKSQRTRSVQRIKHIVKPKKGYIPFAGHGTRVGQGPLGGQIPRPIPNSIINKEEVVSKISERKTSFSKISQTTHTTNSKVTIQKYTQNTNKHNSKKNIRSINDINQTSIHGNKSFSHLSNLSNSSKIKNDSNKFPGEGIAVGSSSLAKLGLNSESGMPYSEYIKTEQTINQTEIKEKYIEDNQSDKLGQKTNEKCNEETYCYKTEEEKKEKCKEETFCVEGKEDKKEKCNEETFCFEGKEDKIEKCKEGTFCFEGKEEIKEKCKEGTFCVEGKEEIKEKCNEVCCRGEENKNMQYKENQICHQDEQKGNEK